MSATNTGSTPDELTHLVLNEFPYAIAVHYERMLREEDWQKKVSATFRVFEFTLRTLTLALLGDYFSDIEIVNDAKLTSEIFTHLSRNATWGVWLDWFMRILHSFKGKPEKLVLSELYELYWDTTTPIHRPRTAYREPFDRFVSIRNEIVHHKYQPPTAQAWAAVFRELGDILRQILTDLAFLQNYDVVRVLRRRGQDDYEYELYTGLQITEPETPLISKEPLVEGWFYLCKQTCAALQFHPLIIGWEESVESEDEHELRDAALLDRFSQKPMRLDYVLPVVGHSVTMTDLPLVNQFIERVFRSVDRIRKQEHEAKTLNWYALKELASLISQRRMSGIAGKFHRDLYLQRESVRHAFEKFLASDEVCFLVTGRSGVGKSNFLLWLLAEYGQSHPEVCLIMYDGAKIEAGRPLGDIVASDLGLTQNLSLESVGSVAAEPWQSLAEVEGIDKKTVVLCIDAINENPDPKGLLRQIDLVVERSELRWKWLKIVVTVRTEAWRVIRRGVRLAEARYYREFGDDQIGTELEPFSYSHLIEPFTQDELEAAYGKYRTVFGLQTPYGALTVPSKQALRDPLVMRLVAETNRNKAILQPIKTDDLVGEYLLYLQRSDQIAQGDVYFLEYELMKLMLGDGIYSNTITDSQIAEATTSDGRRLHELIWAQDLLSGNQHVNQSFRNLLFAEVLVEYEQPDGYRIGFKFERFYDYFAARRLMRLGRPGQGLILAQLQEFSSQLMSCPFLWGALQLLIVKQLEIGHGGLVRALAYTSEPTVQKLLVETLADYGGRSSETRAVVQSIIEPICAEETPDLLDRQPASTAHVARAKSIAVQLAARLSISEPLVRAADDDDVSVRTTMVKEFVHLSRRDTAAGEEVLSRLTTRLVRKLGPIPILNTRVLESVLAACVTTYTLNYRNPLAVEPLRMVTRNALGRMLPFRLESWVGSALSQSLYRPLFGIFTDFIDRTTRERPKQIPANLDEIAVFFSRPSDERSVMHDVIKLFYRESGGILEHRAILHRAAEINDGDINWAVVHLLAGRGSTEPVESASVIKELHEYQLSRERPSYQSAFLLGGFGHFLQKMDPKTRECQALFAEWEELIKCYTSKTRSRTYYLREYISELVSSYVQVSYSLFRQIDFDFVHQALQAACDSRDWELLSTYMRGLASLSADYPQLLTDILLPLLQDGRAEVVKPVSGVLGRIKATHPDILADLLGNYSLNQNLKTYLAIQPVDEPMSDVLFHPLTAWLFDATTSDVLRDSMALLLGQMPYATSIKQWLSMLGAYLVNLAYQGPVFRIKMWPVDVGHKVLRNPYE